MPTIRIESRIDTKSKATIYTDEVIATGAAPTAFAFRLVDIPFRTAQHLSGPTT